MEKRYILALDEGTTSARAVVYDVTTSRIVGISSQEFSLLYPHSGWVEQDANEVWAAQYGALNEAMAKTGIRSQEVYGIGITNQRETVILWDKQTGQPVYNAIVWQCRRTAEYCSELKKDEALVKTIQQKTGLVVDAYFSGSKIKWILDHVPGVRERAERGELYAGTIDSWLIYKLTDGKVFVTDASNASRTMLFNINTMDWDEDLLRLLNIPRCLLPRVCDSNEVVGEASVLREPVPICGIAGDQQSALFGQTCFRAGMAKNTYGTGCFILMNTGSTPKLSANNLLTTVAWSLDGKPTYALEGSVFNAGSSVQWLRDGMQFFTESADSEGFALQARNPDGTQGTNGVYVVPAFTGLGAPYWNQNARGTIVGITRATNRYHIVRATLESMAYSTKDILINMEKDSGVRFEELACDGGASNNNFLMQFQADILGRNIKRPTTTETTALGAVYLCGLGTGVYRDLDDIACRWEVQRTFRPRMDAAEAEKMYQGWKRAVVRSFDWEEE